MGTVVVESSLEGVTVYQQGARVTRTVRVTATHGNLPTQLEVAGLPLSLMDATARVRVAAHNGAGSVVASQVRVGLWVPPREAPVMTVEEAQLLQARRAVERLRASVEALEWEVGLLGGLSVPPRPAGKEGEPPPPSPMQARLALDTFADDALAQRRQRLAGDREALRVAQQEVAELEDSHRRASTARTVTAGELRKSLHVTLRQEGVVEDVTLEVQYLVPGARWAPAYQCRMTRDCRSAQVHMRALVCQATGEDWRGVRMKLSTAQPMTWTEIPELNALRIGRAQPPPPHKAGFRPPPQGSQSLWQDFDRDRGLLARAVPPATAFAMPQLAQPAWPALGAPPPPPPRPQKAARVREEFQRLSTPVSEMEGAHGDVAEDDAFEADMEAPEPPPAPAVASMRAMPAPPAAMAAPGSRGMAAPAPKMAMERRMATNQPAPGRAAGTPDAATLEAVVFTRLRLADATQAHRGRLTADDARTFYLECLTRLQVTASFDVMQTVAEAEQRARNVVSLPLPPATLDVAQSRGNFDFIYETHSPVDVSSDGTFHSIPVGIREGSANVVYVVVPREDAAVYRQAWVKNPLSAPMLSGPVEVYVADEYVLSTSLPTVAPRGEFRLGLGVEQAVRCARNTKFREARSGTKIVATHELIHDIAIDLHNNLEQEVECEVRERIPVPAAGAEVVVEEGTVDPPWIPYDQQDRGTPLEGGRLWRVTLPAHGELHLTAQYVVKLYAQNELGGGNRREA